MDITNLSVYNRALTREGVLLYVIVVELLIVIGLLVVVVT